MATLWSDRVAEVWAPPGRAGSGVVVGATSVLTAAHVVAGAAATDAGVLARAVRPGHEVAAWAPMTVAWRSEEWDVALLDIDAAGSAADAWLTPSSSAVAIVRLGEAAERGCEAVGFPQSALQHDGSPAPSDVVRQSEHVVGAVLPAGQAKPPVRPQHRLTPGRWLPMDIETTSPQLQAGWGGMSGAGVVLPDQRLIGLVLCAEDDHQQRRLYLVPLALVLERAGGLTDALDRRTGGPVVPVARHAPRYRALLDPRCLGPDGLPSPAGTIDDLAAFGVKPTDIAGESLYLTYVPRDRDEELAAALDGAIEERRMLLIVGGSAAGKSRSGAEAVRHALPGHRLLRPLHTTLEALSQTSVDELGPVIVWLDDIERYAGQDLGGPLRRLLGAGIVVVGTIRQLVLEHLDAPGDIRNPAGEALADPDLARPISWPMVWEPTERERVSEMIRSPALRAAVVGGMPLGAYCVGGPKLVQRLQRARADEVHPCRYALVRTVLDWHATFIPDPIPVADALRMTASRVDPDGNVGADELDEALGWATTLEMEGPRRSRRQALLTVEGESLVIHDYVLDHDHRATIGPIPDSVWRTALDRASAQGRILIGAAANAMGRPMTAITAFEALARAGDVTARSLLAMVLHHGDAGATRAWLEAMAGHGEAAVLFGFADRLYDADPEIARTWYREAASHGHDVAMFNLGVLAAERDRDPRTARHWFERAAATGHTGAMTRLAALLADDDAESARRWLERAAAAGHSAAMNNLGTLAERDEPQTARRYYEQAASAGDASAVTNLTRMLADTDPDALRRSLERAADAGNGEAMFQLAVRLANTDAGGAQRWFAQAAETGHVRAMFHHAWTLAQTDQDAAQRWYARAAQAGHAPSMLNLAALIDEQHPSLARQWYERAAKAGLSEAMYQLGLRLAESEPDSARAWFQQAAEAGDCDAMVNVGLLVQDTDPRTARRWYEQAAAGGQRDAMFNLGVLLAAAEPHTARRWYEQAAEAGDREAMENLGALLQETDPETARRWLERAAAT
jgi:TPR repeat protein